MARKYAILVAFATLLFLSASLLEATYSGQFRSNRAVGERKRVVQKEEPVHGNVLCLKYASEFKKLLNDFAEVEVPSWQAEVVRKRDQKFNAGLLNCLDKMDTTMKSISSYCPVPKKELVDAFKPVTEAHRLVAITVDEMEDLKEGLVSAWDEFWASIKNDPMMKRTILEYQRKKANSFVEEVETSSESELYSEELEKHVWGESIENTDSSAEDVEIRPSFKNVPLPEAKKALVKKLTRRQEEKRRSIIRSAARMETSPMIYGNARWLDEDSSEAEGSPSSPPQSPSNRPLGQHPEFSRAINVRLRKRNFLKKPANSKKRNLAAYYTEKDDEDWSDLHDEESESSDQVEENESDEDLAPSQVMPIADVLFGSESDGVTEDKNGHISSNDDLAEEEPSSRQNKKTPLDLPAKCRLPLL